uniref:RNA polymerase I subunit B n=1 Tax=Rousettus aegyptiacus TaxID=9407 RepID=A0A7J8FKU1_ROUAE|nr:RNA polymerase I subunit B [Rousettus aegyptiacus]
MDSGGRWRGLPPGPSLKHLTDPCYGVPQAQQKPALQELTQAHVESFNYAVREGLGHAVQGSRQWMERHTGCTPSATLSCWMASWWAGWTRTLLPVFRLLFDVLRS